MFAKKVSSLIKDVAVEVASLGGGRVKGGGGQTLFLFSFSSFLGASSFSKKEGARFQSLPRESAVY